jgi:hypothetical protein
MIFAAINQLWHAAPLIVAISLVYAGTRHELPQQILRHALRLGFWITAFMAAFAALLFLLSIWL